MDKIFRILLLKEDVFLQQINSAFS